MASRVLTITIGSEVTKLCDVTYTAQKTTHVNKAITIETPDNAVEDGIIKDVNSMSRVIKQTLYTYKMTPTAVIFCIQSSKIANKEITTPNIKAAKLSAYINTNATDYFPVNIDDYVIAYSVLETKVEEDNKVNRVMVAAAPVNLVESYYELAEMLGIKVEAIEYSGNATLQFIRYQIDKAPSIVIQMSEDSTVVTILNNNVLQLMRTVPYGKNTIANAIMEKRGLTYAEAVADMSDTRNALKDSFAEGDEITDSLRYLVNNISRVMDYYTNKNPESPIEKAYVLVEGSAVYGIERLLSNELNIKVEKLNINNQLITVEDSETDITLYIPNVGAVIKPFNFIPKSAVDKVKKANTGKYYRLTVLIAILVSLIIVIFPLTQYLSNLSEKNSIEEQINNLKGIRKTADEYYTAKDKYSDVQAFENLASSNTDYTYDFIKYLEEKMPSDISITAFSVSEGSVSISFSGQAKETMAQFIVALKECPNVEESSIFAPSFSESVGPTGVVTLTGSVTCSLRLATETQAEEESK